jgi:hypothetical protein
MQMRLPSARLMKILAPLLTLFWAGPAWTQAYWDHNGSTMELTSNGAARVLTYTKHRPDLPVSMGTVLFSGTVDSGRYSGTAYVFSSVCGAFEYDVTGGVNVAQRSIVLRGQAPRLGYNCDVIGYEDDVLIFSYVGCGCECGEEPELLAIYGPRYAETTNPEDAKSCPFLYAWDESATRWISYGKVIRNARGNQLEMTDSIKLSQLATKFRLAEEEPEQSFIDHVTLRLLLSDGSQVVLKPTTKLLADRHSKRLYIPAFGAIEFEFMLPEWLKRSDVEQSTISITGYYEELFMCPVPSVIVRKQSGDVRQ